MVAVASVIRTPPCVVELLEKYNKCKKSQEDLDSFCYACVVLLDVHATIQNKCAEQTIYSDH